MSLKLARNNVLSVVLINAIFLVSGYWMFNNSYFIEDYLTEGSDSNNGKVVSYLSSNGIDSERAIAIVSELSSCDESEYVVETLRKYLLLTVLFGVIASIGSVMVVKLSDQGGKA